MASPAAKLPDELAIPVTTALQTGDWSALEQLLDSGQLTDKQKARVIVEVTKSADVHQISQHVSPYCSNAQLSSAMAELISAGWWTEVWNLCQCVGHEHREWQVDNLSISNHLLAIVAKGRWKELGAVLQSFSPAQRQWAVLQACQRAVQLEIIENILPQCAEKDMDCVLHELVSRGLWWAVGSLFSQKRAISETQKKHALNKAAKEATTWEISDFILPHCTRHELVFVSKLLVTRKLWWAFADLLKKDMIKFKECISNACGNEETDLLMSHLLNEGLMKSAQRLLWIARSQKSHWKIGDAPIPGKLIQMAAEGQWTKLAFEAKSSNNPAELAWAMEEMSKKARENEINRINIRLCPINQIPSIITTLVRRRFMKEAALLLCWMVRGTMDEWGEAIAACKMSFRLGWTVVEEMVDDSVKNNEQAFWSLLRNAYNLKDVSELCCKVSEVKVTESPQIPLPDHLRTQFSLYEAPNSALELLIKVLFDSAIDILVVSLCDQLSDSSAPQSVGHQVQLTMEKILNEIRSQRGNMVESMRCLSYGLRSMTRDDSASHPVFALLFILAVVKHCYVEDRWSLHSCYFLTYLTRFPIVPEVQRNALRIMLKRGTWDILHSSDLSRVGEQMRRSLFSSAVKQKRWSFVKQLADHNLNDDQRSWALKEACKEQQWDVYLHLAEHGLSEGELIHAHYNVALKAYIKDVLDMYEHETDIAEVKELLTTSTSSESKASSIEEILYEQRILKLSEIEAKLKSRMECLETVESAIEKGDWQVVVFTLRQDPTAAQGHMALKAAVAGRAWRAVRQMLRLGIPLPDQRSFFLDMVRSRQWDVCRVMIERGLTAEVHVYVLLQLMDLNQWSLVGRIMDCKVEDAVRRQVMTRALQSREGSVVSKAMLGLKQGLSLQEREDIFHRAIIQGVLQAVVPLVKEQDDIGVQHRDTALLHAIREQQWDVVDVCLHHHADINMIGDHENSLINREAQEGNWSSVLALAVRGGDSSLLDSMGLSVLHRAILCRQWGSVESLMALGCDLQQCAADAREKRTSLEMLIDARQQTLIKAALSEKSSVRWQGENGKGETALHSFCLRGWYLYIRRLLIQGADPLSVTCRGHSVLSYAVLSKSSPRMTVAKCISLGFSTHQPRITLTSQQRLGLNVFLSPVLFAVMSGLLNVTQMLYESGSCSMQELSRILPHLHEVTDANSLADTSLVVAFKTEMSTASFNSVHFPPIFRPVKKQRIQKSAQYLIEVSDTPRSLQSTCRLVISHCLQISGSREKDISKLPIPNNMKDYLLFSDLSPSGHCEDHGYRATSDSELDDWTDDDDDDEVWFLGDDDDDMPWYPGYDNDDDDENEYW